MLQNLRDNRNNWLVTVLFGGIILIFVFMFGLPSARDTFKSTANPTLVKVNGQSIDLSLTKSMIMRTRNSDAFGSKVYPEVLRQVSENIGMVYLLADAAREAGLRVSDEELGEYIQNWEYGNSDVFSLGFLYKNKFAQRNYTNGLARISISVRDYEDYKRKELLARRYLILMQSSINVSDESLWAQFAPANATATIEAIRLAPDDILAVLKPLSDEEITAFETAGANGIKEYYDAHIRDFTTPEKARIQVITIQKDLSKLTNPGAKTDKMTQPEHRKNIAFNDIMNNHVEFNQAFDDYDESDLKDNHGEGARLVAINEMAPQIQDAMRGKQINEVFAAELSDRFVIGRMLEHADEFVTPLDEVKHEIAKKMLDDTRVEERTKAVSEQIIQLAQSGKSLEEALDTVLYENVLSEAPEVAMADTQDADDDSDDDDVDDSDDADDDVADDDSDDSDDADDAVADDDTDDSDDSDDAVAADDSDDADDADDSDDAEPEPEMVAEDLPIVVPESSRVKVNTYKDILTNTGYISGVGINDSLARDIRNANAETVLPQTYTTTQNALVNTYIVKVVSKSEASREAFEANLDVLRAKAIQLKSIQLIGDINGIIDLSPDPSRGGYGIWVQQLRDQAASEKRFVVIPNYFDKLIAHRAETEQKEEKSEN